MSFVVNGKKLPGNIDWRFQRSGLDEPERQELIPLDDGSLKQVMHFADGAKIETVLSADGKRVTTKVNREIALDVEQGVVIVLQAGDRLEQGSDGSPKVVSDQAN
ncbi:MAG: hypothetical protein U1D96_06080 [Eubacteriales bacterium]|nr:hypothetical protein [Bacillota bacterium]MBV1726835.1 hypothetical protein [Desulforudis sp.]MDQ7790216.1 hypothetical protein [Clostridia bacterium]MDZ4043048.1 hypothetical protein [Eubacteriales bacterium]MBU4554618.1 hypothetical protein [Bacillota bacterium]